MKPSKGVDTHARELAPAAKAVGITHGVLVQAGGPGADAAGLLASIAHDPGRLRGVVAADPSLDAAALGRLHAGGVRAVRIDAELHGDEAAWAAPAWTALFERALERGCHLEVLPGAGRLAALLPALGRVRIPVVLERFGNPGTGRGALTATLAAAAEIASTRPVWVKLAAPERLSGADPAVLAAHWDRVLGADALVWGSDWPDGPGDYARRKARLGEWVGVERARRILWDNAARLYGF